MSRARSLATSLRHAIGPAMLVLILLSIDRGALLDSLARARPGFALAAAAVVLIAVPLRARRWAGILARLGYRLETREAIRLHAAGTFAGTATPGRLGEVYKAGPLVARGVPARTALASVIADRAFDVAFVVATALLYGASDAGGAAGIAAACVLLAAAALGARAALRLAWPAHGLAALAALPALANAGALTALATGAAWLANHLLVRSLDLPLGALDTAGISAAAALATLAPVSVLGVGTRDAALLVLLARHGGSSSDAVALATLFLLLNVWTGLVCGIALLVPARAPSAADPEVP